MEELNDKLLEYSKKFNDGFPMIPLASGRTNEEIIEIIDECIKKNKDVYELGYVKDDPDIYY
jgi:NCAIR mutase (PurE)-related protein